MPVPGATPALAFPTVESGKLKNGIKVHFARRAAVPTVRVAVSFDAGYAADPLDKRGVSNIMGNLMSEGTTSLTAMQVAEAEERLGADVSVSSTQDRTIASLRAVKPNLAASIDLLADVVKNPAFAEKDLERVRVQQLTRIAGEKNQPQGLAARALPPLIYGKAHPYGGPQTGTGDEEAVRKLTRDDVVAFHQGWIHPAKAEIFVVGDTSLKEITKLLDKQFGQWKPTAAAAPAKNFSTAIPEQKTRIVLIDRPNSPQSFILGGKVLDAKGSDDLLTLRAANEIFGGDFTSRINMDLRETKGWSYGVRSGVSGNEDRVSFLVQAPVQTNQTGPSLAALIGHAHDVAGAKPITKEERDTTVTSNVLELPGSYEQSQAVLGQMRADALFKRPFDYAERLAGKYQAITPEDLTATFKSKVDVDKMSWIVVGDAAKVKPQLEALGLPIEMQGEAAKPADTNAN
jgi:predicted Zn-dependent peptidase